MILPHGTAEPRYRYRPPGTVPLPQEVRGTNGLDAEMLAPLLGTPQVIVPFAQQPYTSDATGNFTVLPLCASVIGPHGSDVMLLELVEKALKSAKWPTEVRVSAEAFFYTEDNDRYVEILKPSPSLEKADPFDDTQPGEMCVDPGPAEAEDLGYLAEGTGSPTHSWSQAEASRYTSGPRSGSLEPGEPTPSMSPLGDSESASATARGSEPGKPTQPISPSGDTTEAASSSESGPAQAKRRRLE